MIKNRNIYFMLIAALALLMGCGNTREALISGSMTGQVKEPTQLRVAVLPFETGEKCDREDAEYIRRQIFINLKGGGYNLVERFVVDGALERNDWTAPQVKEVSPQRLGEALGADAILYGKVTNWERSYLAIHSSITIGAEMRLVDARSGEVLLEANYKKSDFDGILKVPTGLTSVALSPILFLARKSNQYRIADDVTHEMTAYLVKPEKTAPPPHFKEKVFMASAGEALADIEKWSPAQTRNATKPETAVLGAKDEAPPVHSKKEPVPRAAKEGKSYTLQVGSYLLKESASHMARKFQGRGIEAFISEADVKGQRWYRVQVSAFASAADARTFASKNLQGRKLSYFVTPFSVDSVIPLG